MKRWWVVGAVPAAALLVGGVSLAQVPAGPAPAPGATSGITRQVKLSPQEEVVQSDAFLGRMDQSGHTVREALQAARAQRDVVKTLCLNDKLSQLDIALRSARERREQLQAAVQRHDDEAADHEFAIISVLRQRSDQLSMEANLCVGQIGDINEPSQVIATVDPGIPDDPFPWKSPDDFVVLQPPVSVSAIK